MWASGPFSRLGPLALLGMFAAHGAWIAGVVSAQQPLGPEFRVNSFIPGNQHRASIASDSVGGFVVVWEDDFYGIVNIDGQRFDSDGNRVGTDFRISPLPPAAAWHSAVASDAIGNFVVVWHTSGLDNGVFAQRFDSLGTPLGGVFQVNSETSGSQSYPAISMTPAGAFVVVWKGFQELGEPNVFGRRFDPTGQPLGAAFRVNSYTTGGQRAARVATDGLGSFVVAWQSKGQDGDGYGIVARRFDADGNPTGPDFVVNTQTTGYQWYPDVGMDYYGRAIIAWRDGRGQDGSGMGIFARAIAPSGAPSGSEFRVNSFTIGNQNYPSVSAQGSGEFVVSWVDETGRDGDEAGVYARVFAASGAARGPDFRVNTETVGSQDSIRVAAAANGRFTAVWRSHDASGYGVFGQRYEGDLIFADGFESASSSGLGYEIQDEDGAVEP